MNLQELVKFELQKNGNKLSVEFIDSIADKCTATHTRLTDNTRVCVLKVPTGHEIVGIAQVLDSANDVEEIGQSVAYGNARNELWKLCGTIAKCYI